MRNAGTLVAVVLAAAATRGSVACTTFSADEGLPREGDAAAAETGAVDGAAVPDAPASADACPVSVVVNEDFEAQFPPPSFAPNLSSNDAGSVTRIQAGGVDGGAALAATVTVTDSEGGRRARIDRTFEVAPRDIVMELDVLPPSAASLYAEVGCGLFLYGSSARQDDPPRTEVMLVSYDGETLKLAARAKPSNVKLGEASAGPPPANVYLHTKVHLKVAPDNAVHAELDVGGVQGSFDFMLAVPARSITLACGLIYADGKVGDFLANVDNVRVEICGSPP